MGYLDFGQSNTDWMTSSSSMFIALIILPIAGLLWKKKKTQTDDDFKPRDDKSGIFDSLKNPFKRGKRDGDDDFDHVL